MTRSAWPGLPQLVMQRFLAKELDLLPLVDPWAPFEEASATVQRNAHSRIAEEMRRRHLVDQSDEGKQQALNSVNSLDAPFSFDGCGDYPWQLACAHGIERLLGQGEYPCKCSTCGVSSVESAGAWENASGLGGKWRCSSCWAGGANGPAFATREVVISIDGLGQLRVLETRDDYAAQAACESRGEEEAFGSRIWPTACAAAQRILELGVKGRAVLELGCGCAVSALAAWHGGADVVLATDRSVPCLQLVTASAGLWPPASGLFAVELFDVSMSELPLPGVDGHFVCGNKRTGPYVAHSCIPSLKSFDIIVFSDCLYWRHETRAFGRRAAQALAVGASVVVADPNDNWDEFLDALHNEASRLGLPSEAFSVPTPEPFEYNVNSFKWLSLMSGAAAYSASVQPKLLTIQCHCSKRQAPMRNNEGDSMNLRNGRWYDQSIAYQPVDE